MINEEFTNLLKKEIERIDSAGISKRHECIIEGFATNRGSPKAIIKNKEYFVFNSNDYLGLRLNHAVMRGEENATKKYGAGPGAVRFISGTLQIHKELEKNLASFHGREDAIIFSSAFAANSGVINALIQGSSKDSLIHNDVLVISDELNHRSIIDGIKVAGLPAEKKTIFKHLNLIHLDELLQSNKTKYKRVIIITDGIFSMLGEYQDLKKLNEIVNRHNPNFSEGIITILDDSHGVGVFGENGRGCEEFCSAKCNVLIATMGKALGADGGYAVGDKTVIDYIRESAAPYIFSNSISPGTAGAALASLEILNSKEGKELQHSVQKNIMHFKKEAVKHTLALAADSLHPIQPILIGDAQKTKQIVKKLFDEHTLVTGISYPIVPRGKDEIRVQLSALHTTEEINHFIKQLSSIYQEI